MFKQICLSLKLKFYYYILSKIIKSNILKSIIHFINRFTTIIKNFVSKNNIFFKLQLFKFELKKKNIY